MNKNPITEWYCCMRDALNGLQENGYCIIRGSTIQELQKFASDLGQIVYTTEVQVNINSRALVTSDRELKLHTDHHAVNYIAWYCHKQSTAGGESVLLDTNLILPKLSNHDVQALRGIHAYEHKVFDDDAEQHPILSKSESNDLEVYYSYWLMDDKDRVNIHFQKLKELIEESKPLKFRLEANDVLILNNKRVLHGRTEIQGDKDRHLTRYWIK
ncbi:TauD/TfdA family dioxygenase [Endozoicomonas sp. SCSIO W0465]|uniref:TauD/TfdA family dioxygenase n=1 Tax=Endozoicomonas sp. SCSIO W0465 TaxID=2918516 RepID=UPI002075951F|nr:TauD/TfdA family dioxygenase [Endozoicomonas sp. SCSIO W0465]USE39516.1 TauD/TfdA family dioxygenase [Endozoicomonas sp. SCSIO W0465]